MLNTPVTEFIWTFISAAAYSAFRIVPPATMATDAKKNPNTISSGLIMLSIR